MSSSDELLQASIESDSDEILDTGPVPNVRKRKRATTHVEGKLFAVAVLVDHETHPKMSEGVDACRRRNGIRRKAASLTPAIAGILLLTWQLAQLHSGNPAEDEKGFLEHDFQRRTRGVHTCLVQYNVVDQLWLSEPMDLNFDVGE